MMLRHRNDAVGRDRERANGRARLKARRFPEIGKSLSDYIRGLRPPLRPASRASSEVKRWAVPRE
jgi:hypothetical protein